MNNKTRLRFFPLFQSRLRRQKRALSLRPRSPQDGQPRRRTGQRRPDRQRKKRSGRAEREQALQDFLRIGQPRAGRGDLQVRRCAAGRDPVAAILRRRGSFSAARERSRCGCFSRAADVFPGRSASGRAADHDGRAEARLGRAHHGCDSLLRLCAAGPQRPAARRDYIEAGGRSSDHGRCEPRAARRSACGADSGLLQYSGGSSVCQPGAGELLPGA